MRPSFVLAALTVLAAAPAQQLFFARNDDTTYGPYAVGWPAAVLAFKFTATANQTIAAAEVFTGNQPPAAHSVEIRAHDPVTGNPGVLIGQLGTWQTLQTRCWQGAFLAQPAPISAGQDYWLVWRVSGMFHQHSVSADGNPANVLVDVAVSDGSSWFAHTQLAAKFRLFAPYAAGTIATFGTAKPGQYGPPQIGLSGWPALGSRFDVWLDNAARRQPAFLAIGQPIPGGIPLGFATSYTTADALLFLTTVLQNGVASPLVGGLSFTFVVPNLPSATGFPLTFQWAVFDPLAPDSLSHTGAATATLQ